MRIVDKISHCGSDDEIVFKHSCEQFARRTIVEVGVNQIAVLVRDGKVADILHSGLHSMEPHNIPLMTEILRSLSQDKMPLFSARIYYFNTSCIPNLRFGTSVRIQEQLDRRLVKSGVGVIPVEVGIYGRYRLQIDDPVLLLKSLLADRTVIRKEFLEEFFRSVLKPAVKMAVLKIVKRESVSIFELERCIAGFSMEICNMVACEFEKVGMSLISLQITKIEPTGEGYDQCRSIYMDDAVRWADAVTTASCNRELGITQPQRMMFDLLKSTAKNSSSGQMMGAGMNMAAMRSMYQAFNQVFKDFFDGGMYNRNGSKDGMQHGAESEKDSSSDHKGDGGRGTFGWESSFQQVCPVCGGLNPAEACYCMYCSFKLINQKGVR